MEALWLGDASSLTAGGHWVIPFAALPGEGAWAALAEAGKDPLPKLRRLLACLHCEDEWQGEEWSAHAPHEALAARARGWSTEPWPFAAASAAADGLNAERGSWAMLSPCHWHVGREQVSLLDPALLNLGEEESRAFFDALRPLFEEEGHAMHWGSPLRWYLQHASLAGLRTASLERSMGRPVDLWLQAHEPNEGGAQATDPETRAGLARLRRLQSEVQMRLYTHPLNEARQARGELALNSVWISGCGAVQPATSSGSSLLWAPQLRHAALQGDDAGWAKAWQWLDATLLNAAWCLVQQGRPLRLSLCGERRARTLHTGPQGLGWLERGPQAWWRRTRRPPHLEPLSWLREL
jgi:hypothetical protein